MSKTISEHINDGYPNSNPDFESFKIDGETSQNLNSYINMFNLKYK